MLYMWRSKYLKHYGEGYIFVEAPTLEEARTLAYTKFETHVRDERLFTYEGWQPDEDDLDDIKQYLRKLKEDLEQEPTIIQNDAVFVEGSD